MLIGPTLKSGVYSLIASLFQPMPEILLWHWCKISCSQTNAMVQWRWHHVKHLHRHMYQNWINCYWLRASSVSVVTSSNTMTLILAMMHWQWCHSAGSDGNSKMNVFTCSTSKFIKQISIEKPLCVKQCWQQCYVVSNNSNAECRQKCYDIYAVVVTMIEVSYLIVYLGHNLKSGQHLLTEATFASGHANKDADSDTDSDTMMLMLEMMPLCQWCGAGSDRDVMPIIYIGHILKWLGNYQLIATCLTWYQKWDSWWQWCHDADTGNENVIFTMTL